MRVHYGGYGRMRKHLQVHLQSKAVLQKRNHLQSQCLNQNVDAGDADRPPLRSTR